MVKNTLITVLVLAAFVLVLSISLPAQEPQGQAVSQGSVDQDIQLLREDVRSQKKQIVAANMELTDAEATKFWPVYDQYTAETAKIGDTRVALVKEYAQTYDTMTDAQAKSLVQRWAAADEATWKLRSQYIPKFEQVLPGKKAALFFQLDHRLAMMIDLKLASMIPMVKP